MSIADIPVTAVANESGRSGGAEHLAAAHGLLEIGTRPPLARYVRSIWQRRSFIWGLATNRAYSYNAGTYLGQAWTLVEPALAALWWVMIFGVLFSGTGANQIGFIVVGIFTYREFNHAVMSGARVISRDLNLIRSHSFPRAVVPLADSLSYLILFIPTVLVMLLIIIISGFIPGMTPVPISSRWIGVIPFVVTYGVFCAGVTCIFARIGARRPDLAGVLQLPLNVIQFASGAMFALSIWQPLLGERGVGLLKYFPTTVYVYLMRSVALSEPDFPPSALMWILGIAYALITFVLGFLFFWRAEETYGRD